MTYCINPHCPKSVDPVNANNLICRNCGSEILLQGRYRVLKQLGQGGFGNTFEVDECGKTKVLKVLTENNPKAIELFQQEAKVLSQINSAGIPKVELETCNILLCIILLTFVLLALLPMMEYQVHENKFLKLSSNGFLHLKKHK